MPPSKTKKYCCVCSNYRGKVVNDREVSLHRFPANERIRRAWMQRCKLIMKTFKYTENHSRMCSEHFEGYRGPSFHHPIPSIFGTKRFQTSKLDEHVADNSHLKNVDDMDYASPSDDDDCQVNFIASGSSLDTSLRLHDYDIVPEPESMAQIRHQYCNVSLGPDTVSISTQTEECKIKQTRDIGTQIHSKQVSDLGVQVDLPCLTFEDVKDDDQMCSFYTGIPESKTMQALFEELVEDAVEGTGGGSKDCAGGRPRTLRLIDEFFLVLMRLRLGLLLEDLAFRFRISSSTCGEIFNKWIDYLVIKLEFLVMWPSREIIDEHMPDIFRSKFPRTRVVVDCTEIWTENPDSLQLKSLLYSDYKSHHTWKSLIGISPSGIVTFVSDLYAGSVSDKIITQQCGLLELCEPGDAIMADKGFVISDLTTPKGIYLIIPPFKRKPQFSKREVHLSKDIAQARIHVERQMERIKNFRIFHGVLPISMAPRSSKIWKICVYLTNLQPPLVHKSQACHL